MAQSLQKRKNVGRVMNLLDHLTNIKKCLHEIERSTYRAVSLSSLQKTAKKLVQVALASAEQIKLLAGELGDRLTVIAHRHMACEDMRPATLKKVKGPAKRRSSDRHAENVKKRKFVTLDLQELEASLTDLHQAGRLSTPVDVCKIIMGDDSPGQKKQRSYIYKLLSSPKFAIAAEKTLRNTFTRYKKFLAQTGPPLAPLFGSRRPPTMSVCDFLENIKKKLQQDEHKQKDLRQLTLDVLAAHKVAQFTATGTCGQGRRWMRVGFGRRGGSIPPSVN